MDVDWEEKFDTLTTLYLYIIDTVMYRVYDKGIIDVKIKWNHGIFIRSEKLKKVLLVNGSVKGSRIDRLHFPEAYDTM
jgi:hypothetical protein